ncbi:short chain dehydrogenase [Pedobacter sp. BAL39]|uniref:hypothetical protein n=1 Tax=Pedobacter sp. BAL39 TaxID=391596 RepID=UPI000155961E|nr:hypothetical protein [Pedobacter sp. BAL39]EDM36896.1 short chain dehydrogenase [Pedobacter sp. BAL39]
MRTNSRLLLLFFIVVISGSSLLISGCSDPVTDALLLEKDKHALQEKINYEKVMFYKFVKIAMRSAAVQDTNSKEFRQFAKHSQTVMSSLNQVDVGGKERISVAEAFLMYQDYRKVKGFVKETDEDQFPSLVEGFNAVYGDTSKTQVLLRGSDKIYQQNVEHAILSVLVLASRDLGQDFALYECAYTKPELLDDGEMKTLLEFIRGFLFFNHGLYYLSEDGYSRNIEWLNKHTGIGMPYTKAFFGWSRMNDEQTHIAFHSMNHLFRGFDRMRMERDIDEERGLEDFEAFLEDTRKLGLENEVVWGVDSYLQMKKGKPEAAIAPLKKLRNSPLFGKDEQAAIDQTIVHLQEKDPDAALNGVYDKVFLTKIATKYMISVLSKINWKELLKKNKVPHADKMFATVDRLKAISNATSEFSAGKTMEKGKKDLKEKGAELLKKADGILDF